MLLGCRVVRGPDWKWGEQDGGEGGVGTIVNLERFSDDRKLPSRTVLVCWDNGYVSDYRAGSHGCCELRILDSAPAGVRHQDFYCDSCFDDTLAGIRWHCLQCYDYDLCSICYMGGFHEINHEFVRYDKPNDKCKGVLVGKRSEATQIECKGMFIGALVDRGRDWNHDSDFCGMSGRVVDIIEWEGFPRSAVTVKWGEKRQSTHRVGYHGKVDLKAVTTSSVGLWYYKEHLPLVKLHGSSEYASTDGEQLKEGDMVAIPLDSAALKSSLAEKYVKWIPRMEKCLGEVGQVDKVYEDGDVQVNWNIQWVFIPEVLVKIHSLRPGDKVRVLENKQLVTQYQNVLGFLDSGIEKVLGGQGVVLDVKNDGKSANIQIGKQVWNISTAALLLESRDNENRLPGSKTTGVDQIEPHWVRLDRNIGQLVRAATLGNLDKVKEILQKDKRLINQKSASEKTALHSAGFQGHAQIVSYLLGNGADKEIKDEDGYTALHHAAYGDRSGICVMLLSIAKANLNVQDGKTMSTPLHLAIKKDNENAVEALTQFRGCDANLKNKDGDTPLHQSVRRGQNKISKAILDNCKETGLDPSILSQKGTNALHLACRWNNIEVATILINRYPALVSMGSEDDNYPIHFAAMYNCYEIAKLLLQSGHCSVDEKNKEGRTALSIAVGESNRDMIELLITNNANPNKEDNDGYTPLHIAIMKHAMLSKRGNLSIEYRIQNDTTTEEHTSAIAVFLVTKGADATHRNHKGETPLNQCTNAKLRKEIENAVRTVPGSPNSATSPTDEMSTVPPIQEVSTTPPTEEVSTTTPTEEVSKSPATEEVSTSSPTEEVSKSPATEEVSTSSPTEEVSKSPPTEEVSTSSPTEEVPKSTPAEQGSTSSPADEVSKSPPTEEVSISSPTEKADVESAMACSVEPRLVKGAMGTVEAVSRTGQNDPPNDDAVEGTEQNNTHGAVGGKKLNIQISSEIEISNRQEIVACRFCTEEEATVTLMPCNHTVLCQQCAVRAKVCVQCNRKIKKKIAKDGVTYKSLTDFKKMYEKIKKEKDDLE